MLECLDIEVAKKSYDKKHAWLNQINDWKSRRARPVVESAKLSPQTVIERIYELTKDRDPIIATEVGQHQMWTASLYKFDKPRRFVSSGGLGTMGFGFPAAMGAKVANPDKLVIDIAGDGSIQMNIQELATCIHYNIPVKIFIINNGYLGMVRQWQEKLFNKRYSHTVMTGPDYVKLAEAYGAKGYRVSDEKDLDSTILKAINSDGLVVVDFIVESFEIVYPWVLAGDPINKVLLGDDIG